MGVDGLRFGGGFVAAATVSAFRGGLVVELRFAAAGVMFVGFIRLCLFGFLLFVIGWCQGGAWGDARRSGCLRWESSNRAVDFFWSLYWMESQVF